MEGVEGGGLVCIDTSCILVNEWMCILYLWVLLWWICGAWSVVSIDYIVDIVMREVSRRCSTENAGCPLYRLIGLYVHHL